MLEAGLLSEAKEVINGDFRNTAVQAIGYKELMPYFEDKITLEDKDLIDQVMQLANALSQSEKSALADYEKLENSNNKVYSLLKIDNVNKLISLFPIF